MPDMRLCHKNITLQELRTNAAVLSSYKKKTS